MAARVIWDYEAAGSRPATETRQACAWVWPWLDGRAVGREPAGAGSTPAIHPQVHALSCVANSSGSEPAYCPGWSGFKPLATHHPSTPSWRNRQTHRSQKPAPTGHVRSTRTEGTSQPSDRRRRSSALTKRWPVDRAHPGPPSRTASRDHQPPRRCAMKTIDGDDMSFQGHEQTTHRLPPRDASQAR